MLYRLAHKGRWLVVGDLLNIGGEDGNHRAGKYCYTIHYSYQSYLLRLAGETPRLVFAAIDPKTGIMGGFFFTFFYLFRQFVNAFMEEAIFHKIVLPDFMLKFCFWKANLLQAFLFGFNNLVFPFSSLVNGHTTMEQFAP